MCSGDIFESGGEKHGDRGFGRGVWGSWAWTCQNENGVVQGYELLKTDDIFLLKGISENGTPAFHPQVVQQNGHSVLRFLQDNCQHDPGAYWVPNSKAKCARHFKICFDFLDEQEHLAKAWTLVGDVYIEHQITRSTETSVQPERKVSSSELRISTEVEKEACGRKKSNVKKLSLLALGTEDEHPNLGVRDVNGSDSAYLNKRDANTQSSIVDKMYTVERTTLDTNHRRHDGTSEMYESTMSTKSDDGTKEVSNGRIGGIFKFLKGPIAGDTDYNLSAALSCYNAVRKALAGLQTGSAELQSVLKKK
ncbi:hypothetical protein IFM89_016343 [Coptis chinensis]|uniref:Uncharacterized protein n=1 Tax=Coptis chinensis TaxID=261450 RepID=A0A835LLS7_9MAGN|nr:hypothetical protein IFM89_016343 [Coptis chinensis]